jgi:hypothetical protein
MTDLEEIYDQRGDPRGITPSTLAAVAGAKGRRKTYNYRKIEALQTALADLHAAHIDLQDRYGEVVAEVEDARRHIANQHDTLAAEHTTAEWAVEEAWGARRELSDHAQSVTVAYLLVGLASVVAWEILWSLGRGVFG